MSIIDEIFKNKKFNKKALLKYGFMKKGNSYVYKTLLNNSQFEMTVTISNDKLSAILVDSDLNEEYILHLLPSSQGEFIGKIKSDFEAVLFDIAEKCTSSSVFTSKNTIRIIDYAKNNYNDDLEFLWKNFPDCAVLRRKDTKKWYAIIMCVSERKLGLDSDKIVEVINFRVNPDETQLIIDNKKYFTAYHMNKKSWITANLSEMFEENELETKVSASYLLAIK